jgi:hypothetical protein
MFWMLRGAPDVFWMHRGAPDVFWMQRGAPDVFWMHSGAQVCSGCRDGPKCVLDVVGTEKITGLLCIVSQPSLPLCEVKTQNRIMLKRTSKQYGVRINTSHDRTQRTPVNSVIDRGFR